MNKKAPLSSFQLIIYLLIVTACYGQTEGDYRTAISGYWSDVGTWETYNGNTWIAATSSPSSSNGVITIRNGYTVTVDKYVIIDQTLVEPNGLLKINSSIMLAVNNGIGIDLSVNGTVDNSGNLRNQSSGTLQFNSNSTYIHNRSSGDIPIALWEPSSTCKITGYTNSQIGGFGQSFGNFIWDCPNHSSADYTYAVLGMSIAGDLIVNQTGRGYLEINQAQLSIKGNLILNNGILRVSGTNTNTYNILGSIMINGGNLLMSWNGRNSTLNVAGDFSHTAGEISGTGSIIFNGTKIQNFYSEGSKTYTINFTINNGATLQMADESTTVSGSGTFNLLAGGSIGITSADGIAKTGSTGNIRVTGTRTFDNNAIYIYNGSAAQTTGSGLTIAKILVINNTNGITLSQDVNVSGKLNLINGQLTTGPNSLLTLTDGAIVEGAKNESFINGPIKKIGDEAFTFPVGKNNKYVPITISAPQNAADAFIAEYFPSGYINLDNITSPGLIGVSSSEYWNLQRSAGYSNVDVILNWYEDINSSSPEFTSDPAAITIAHFDGNCWNAHGGSGTGTMTNGSVTWKGVSAFSPFTFGKIALDHPLPVHFDNIKASEKPNGIQIDFTNLTEERILFYEVERADDGKTFIAVKKLMPYKNDNGISTYSILDTTVIKGKYIYRIKAVENTGKVVFSNFASIEIGSKTYNVHVFAKDGYIFYQGTGFPKGKYTIQIFNAAGQRIAVEHLFHIGGSFSLIANLNISKTGVYFFTINGPMQLQKKFIVQ